MGKIKPESVWIIEYQECGYRPFQDGPWLIYTTAGFGTKEAAQEAAEKLQSDTEDYSYLAVEYVRKS